MLPVILSPLQARVLGVLVEKQHTVPDTYPLSLNALLAGCNQKTARSPVIEASETDLQGAIDALKQMHLLFEVSGSRVVRYEHNMGRALGVPSQSVALLATLLLRGPQTAAELRVNCERLHRFADLSSVEAFLDELSTKEPHRVVRLARAPGARESRWAHLLCGVPQLPLAGEGGDMGLDMTSVSAGEMAALQAQVARLAEQLGQVQAEVAGLKRELGLAD
jgi:uncharacterized protein YceH (UPF0502 family)